MGMADHSWWSFRIRIAGRPWLELPFRLGPLNASRIAVLLVSLVYWALARLGKTRTYPEQTSPRLWLTPDVWSKRNPTRGGVERMFACLGSCRLGVWPLPLAAFDIDFNDTVVDKISIFRTVTINVLGRYGPLDKALGFET